MKNKVVMLEACRVVTDDEGEEHIVGTEELFVLNDNIVNAFTSKEHLVNNIPIGELHFIVKNEHDSNTSNYPLTLTCTIEQAVYNLGIIKKMLEEFEDEKSNNTSGLTKKLIIT